MREVFYGVISQGVAPYFFEMKDVKICSFFGHRDVKITEELYATTTAEILKAVDFGCRIFYFGGYGSFDDLCYKIVTKIKKENPQMNITRIYCVAQEKYLRKSSRYFSPEDYDEVIYLEPSFNGWYKSIYFRNLAMIDNSDYIIFCCGEIETSGAYKAYKYAKKRYSHCKFNVFINKKLPLIWKFLKGVGKLFQKVPHYSYYLYILFILEFHKERVS